ncbi:MAG: AtpZ/AtpI family protein [Bacteroidota bacterium]|jgi:F0F1-type ATP synthase assembly protein I
MVPQRRNDLRSGTEPITDEKRTEGESGVFSKAFRVAGPLFGIGIQLAAAVVMMFFVGRWLDQRWGTTPWMMLVGTMVGAAAGFYQFIKTVNDVNKRESEKRNKIDL